MQNPSATRTTRKSRTTSAADTDRATSTTRKSRATRTPRILAATGLALASGLVLAACSGGSGGGGGASDDLTATGPITIWYSNNATEVEWGKQMVEAWNAENPDQEITAQEIPAGKSSEEVIGAAITAGNAPCLVLNTAPSAVGQFEKQGGLVNLSEFPDGAQYIETRSGDLAEQYQNADGDYFQFPWKSNPVVIFYNKDLFAQAGLDPENPKLSTYDDFLATSEALVDAGVAPYAIQPAPTSEFFQMQFDFYPLYAAATGGAQIVEDGKATFADEAGYEAAGFWRDLYDQGLAGQEQYQGDSFADSQAAMAIVGPWAISVYGDMNFGSVPVPTPEATPADEVWTFSDAKNIGLFSACENKGTAWEVLKFATSEEQDGQFLELTGQMPLRQDLPTVYADYFAANPEYVAFGDQASRTVEVPAGPNTMQIMQTFRDAWSKAVIFGEGDVDAALDEAAATIDGLASQP